MRKAARQLTLQELRRMHQAASNADAGSLMPGKNAVNAKAKVADHPIEKVKGSINTAKSKTKTKSRGSKMPRQFGCRKRAPAHGAVVLPDGEEAGPLLISGNHTASGTAAVSPEVESYRAAVAAYQLKRVRGGLKSRSASAGSRDPRFSDLCGKLDVASCAKAYSFVEEQQQQLMKQLQHVVKTGRVPTEEAGSKKKGRKVSTSEREQAEKQLQRLQSQQQQRERRAAEAALRASLSRAEREQIAATGKRPHYVSKKKLRELLREQQQQTASNKKKIKREIKERKKALAKERKLNYVPQRRNRRESDEV